jgi:hypothetical protein
MKAESPPDFRDQFLKELHVAYQLLSTKTEISPEVRNIARAISQIGNSPRSDAPKVSRSVIDALRPVANPR